MPSFFCLPMPCQRTVTELDLSQSNLQSIPTEIFRYRKLGELNLAMNNIKELNKQLFNLTNLRVLDVSNLDKLLVLPPEIGRLTQLIELNLSNCKIAEIPESLKSLKNLSYLNLDGNPLPRLPDSICECASITILSLNYTGLTSLPANIGFLTNLRVLETRDNHLRQVPSSICELKQLEVLDLGLNEIEELPQKLGKLVNLRVLFIDVNNLSSLPDSIVDCRNLDVLDVSDNQILQLPEEIGNMTSLSDLNISQNALRDLPESIGKLRRLQILKADRNSLTHLTPEIGKCQSLTELYLATNLFSELPDILGQLKNLTTLNADCNQLTDIPETIGECKSLTVLSLRQNNLTELPMEIGKCENLTVLDVASNKLSYLPFTVKVLYKLQALWLSEDQTQSILKLSETRDDKKGVKVVTCYLLPQFNAMEDREHGGDKLGQANRSFIGGPKVHFHDQQDSTFEEERAADVQLGNFERHNTPHPKTPKYKKGSIDGHMVPHDMDQPRQLSLAQNHRTSTSSFGESSNSINRDLSDIRFIDAASVPNGVRDATSPDREDLGTSMSSFSNTGSTGQNMHTIMIQKDETGVLGLSFAGGANNGPAPNSNGESGLFVTKVTPGSAAERSGLRTGDKLIRANNENMVNASQEAAMNAIRKSETVELVVVRRTPSPVSRTSEMSFGGSTPQLDHDAGSPDSALFLAATCNTSPPVYAS